MKQLGLSLVGAIKNFEQARRTEQQADAETLERLAKRAGMTPQDAARLAMNLAPLPKPETEPFIMLQPAQNAAVVRWIAKNSKRPMNASQLWAELFTAAHPSTGDILLTRAELAARLGLEPRTISELMTELAGINAITRRKEGRRVIYAMNPNVATHIAGPEARKAARDAAGPLLTLMEGGKT